MCVLSSFEITLMRKRELVALLLLSFWCLVTVVHLFFLMVSWIGLQSVFVIVIISNNVVCATSKATDQPAHTRSLIRAFASRLNIL